MKSRYLKQLVECDAFVDSLPARLRNCLLRHSLTSEAQIRDSFARDGGLSIANIENLGSGYLHHLQIMLECAADRREEVAIRALTPIHMRMP